jgi:putative ABC transport system ATP-binding protein
VLRSKGIQFSYGKEKQFSFPDLYCGRGEQLLLLGQSGTGKTTLLHLLAGLLRPETGSIEIDGVNICALRNNALDKYRGEKVGIVYQTAHFVSSLSVLENLLLPQFFTGKNPSAEKALVLLRRLNLEHTSKMYPSRLSIGEQQRVAIARALMNDPALIFADEPSSALDDKNTNEVLNLLVEQSSAAGAALVVVTHDQRVRNVISRAITL